MITWLQNVFGKHFKWLFAALLIIVTFAFVFTLGVGTGGPARRHIRNVVFGLDLADPNAVDTFNRDTSLSLQLQAGPAFASISGAQFNNYFQERLVLLGLADDLGLPPPSVDQMRSFVQSLPGFLDPRTRQFDPAAYNRFVDQVSSNPQIGEEGLGRVLEQDFRARTARDLLAGPGYLLPADIGRRIADQQTAFSVDVAERPYDAFQPDIAIDDAAVRAYFEQQAARYEIPERRRVAVVDFPASAFADGVAAPTEAELRRHFDANPSRFAPPATDAANPPQPPDFASVTDQVAASLRRERAAQAAASAATDFTVALFNAREKGTVTADPASLLGFATAQGRPASVTTAFTASTPPEGFGWDAPILGEAFRLNDARLSTDPLETPAGFIVLLWQESIAPTPPPFDDVRDRVVADWRDEQRRRLFIESGAAIRADLEARLLAGASFADAATAAGLGHSRFEGVTRLSPPAGFPRELLDTLPRLADGAVSDMVALTARGLFARVTSRKAPTSGGNDFIAQFIDAQSRRDAAGATAGGLLAEFLRKAQSAPADGS